MRHATASRLLRRGTAWLLGAILLTSSCRGDSGDSAHDGGPNLGALNRSALVAADTGSKWGLTATDWLESWGTFEFTIDNLAPGEYRLLVGEYPPIDDSDFVGVTIPFVVSVP